MLRSMVPKCESRLIVQSEPDPINKMVTVLSSVPTDLLMVVHSSHTNIYYSSEGSPIHTLSSRPTGMGSRRSEHKLVGSHSIHIPSYGSPSKGNPENAPVQLPTGLQVKVANYPVFLVKANYPIVL